VDFLFFPQGASVFPDRTDFLPAKASILDGHPKQGRIHLPGSRRQKRLDASLK